MNKNNIILIAVLCLCASLVLGCSLTKPMGDDQNLEDTAESQDSSTSTNPLFSNNKVKLGEIIEFENFDLSILGWSQIPKSYLRDSNNNKKYISITFQIKNTSNKNIKYDPDFFVVNMFFSDSNDLQFNLQGANGEKFEYYDSVDVFFDVLDTYDIPQMQQSEVALTPNQFVTIDSFFVGTNNNNNMILYIKDRQVDLGDTPISVNPLYTTVSEKLSPIVNIGEVIETSKFKISVIGTKRGDKSEVLANQQPALANDLLRENQEYLRVDMTFENSSEYKEYLLLFKTYIIDQNGRYLLPVAWTAPNTLSLGEKSELSNYYKVPKNMGNLFLVITNITENEVEEGFLKRNSFFISLQQ